MNWIRCTLVAAILCMAACGGEATLDMSADTLEDSRLWLVQGGESKNLEISVDSHDGVSDRVVVETYGVPDGVTVSGGAVIDPSSDSMATLVFAATEEAELTTDEPATFQIVATDDDTEVGVLNVDLIIGGEPGSLDTSFGDDGIVVSTKVREELGNFSTAGLNYVLRDDDAIVIAMRIRDEEGGNSFGALVSYQPDGTLDRAFGGDGIVKLPQVNNGWLHFNTLAIDGEGLLLAAGHTVRETGDRDLVAARLKLDGNFDDSFGEEGLVVHDFMNTTRTILVDQDDKIVIGANMESSEEERKMGLARLEPEGDFDESFGNDGTVVVDSHRSRFDRSLVQQEDGTYFISGERVPDDNNEDRGIACSISRSGTLEPKFGDNGCITFDSERSASAIAPDDRLYLAHSYVANTVVFAFEQRGEPLLAFGDGGIAEIPMRFGSLTMSHSSKLYTVGSKRNDDRVAQTAISQLSPGTGAIDSGFGTIEIDVSRSADWNEARWLDFDSLGRLVIGGTITADEDQFFLMRMWP